MAVKRKKPIVGEISYTFRKFMYHMPDVEMHPYTLAYLEQRFNRTTSRLKTEKEWRDYLKKKKIQFEKTN